MNHRKNSLLENASALPRDPKLNRQTTAPAILVNAPARNIFPQLSSTALHPRTAPAHVPGQSTDLYYDPEFNYNKPEHSNATMQENTRLAQLLNFLHTAGGGGATKHKDDFIDLLRMEDKIKANTKLIMAFEKNFVEISRLIDGARAFDESTLNGGLKEDDLVLTTVLQQRGDRKKKEGKERQADRGEEQATVGAATTPEDKVAMMGDLFHLETDKVQYGRKPVREIMEELFRRVEGLKSNQNEWDRFLLRVSQIRAEREPSGPQDVFLKRNIINAKEFLPEVRYNALKLQQEERGRRRQIVLQNKIVKEHQDTERKLAQIRKKEAMLEKELRKQRELREAGYLKKWAFVIVLGSRLQNIKQTLDDEHKRKHTLYLRNRAARIIQKKWKKHQAKLREARVRHSLRVIGKVFRVYVARRRERKKLEAADILREFFKEVHDCSRLFKVIKKYRSAVLGCQTLARNFIRLRRDRIHLLALQWDKLEPAFWANRKSSKDDSDGKKKSTKKKGKKSDDSVHVRIPDEVKFKVLESYFMGLKKEHRNILKDYHRQLDVYNSAFEKEQKRLNALQQLGQKKVEGKAVLPKDGPQVPRKPFLKLLMTEKDMLGLIEKAFINAASAGSLSVADRKRSPGGKDTDEQGATGLLETVNEGS